MKCIYCNKEVSNDYQFCPNCGSALNNFEYTTTKQVATDCRKTYHCQIQKKIMHYHGNGHGNFGPSGHLMNVKVMVFDDTIKIDFNDGNVDEYPFSSISSKTYNNSIGLVLFLIVFTIMGVVIATGGGGFFAIIPILMIVIACCFFVPTIARAGKSVSLNTKDNIWIIVFNSTSEKENFLKIINQREVF